MFLILNNIINLFKYFKYFIYFNLLLNSIFLNYLSYKINNNFYFVKYLYFTINLNGCFIIKLSQWFNTQLHSLEDNTLNNNNFNKFKNLFDNFFENCYLHNINYTKKIFKKDFNIDFDEIIELDNDYNIKSGSIAQVYKGKFKKQSKFNNNNDNNNDIDNIAIKVVHPDLKYQVYYIENLIYFYQYLVENFEYFKKYDTIFDFNSFIKNLKLQFNMNNEHKNMSYYYNYFHNENKNEYIVIPKPIICSENILIMEYIDGEVIDEINVSEIEKKNILSLFLLFSKCNYLFMDYFHNDLHGANWKVIKHKNFFKLVIYDYGYIINNNFNQILKDLLFYCDTNNINGCAEVIYKCIKNKKYDLDEFKKIFSSYIKKTLPYTDDFLLKVYIYIYQNNLKTINNLLEFFVLMILMRKHLKKYFMQDNDNNISTTNYQVYSYLYQCEIAKKYNIFENLVKYYEDRYFNNPEFLKNIEYRDNYLEKLDNENNNSIDI